MNKTKLRKHFDHKTNKWQIRNGKLVWTIHQYEDECDKQLKMYLKQMEDGKFK